MKDDMRGLFYIVKGQYQKDNSEDGVCVSGFNPESKNTNEWYQVRDNTTFYSIYGGSSLDSALNAIRGIIERFGGDKKKYFKYVCGVTNEDYYETHYKGKLPLSPEDLAKKQEGKCPRVSPATKVLQAKVYKTYGDYYRPQIEVMEDQAYENLSGQTPFHKSKKLVKKLKTSDMVNETPQKVLVKKDKPQEEKVITTPKKGLVRKPVLKKRTI